MRTITLFPLPACAALGALTLPTSATDKAWVEVSLSTNATEPGMATQPGQPSSGLPSAPRMAAFGGGLMIQGGGTFLGATCVSGSPIGDADDACANAGIAAIQVDLEMWGCENRGPGLESLLTRQRRKNERLKT